MSKMLRVTFKKREELSLMIKGYADVDLKIPMCYTWD